MANELPILKIDVSQLSDEQINELQNQILNFQDKLVVEKLNRIEQSVKYLANDLNKSKAEVELIKNEVAITKEMIEQKTRVLQPKYGFVNQKSFGLFFNPSIGAKTVGKLLKVVGLAQKNVNATTPYRQYIPDYANTFTTENYTAFVWNYEKCVEKIDEWLKEHGYYEKFYSIADTKKMEDFINYLYQKYC